jgi:hypothetical protein
MDLTLKRTDFSPQGIFGQILDVNNTFKWVTAEHAYPTADGDVYAKIPFGQWICRRGLHRLDGMLNDFETFEIMDVPGRTNLLFHWGNYPQIDSQGCILLGQTISDINGLKAVSMSKVSWNEFMQFQDGIDQFNFTVTK